MATTLAAVVEALHAIAPPELAETWDNVGLLLGDPAARCDRVLVALDADVALVRRAARAGAQFLLTHHPPILHPIRSITADAPAGRLLLEAARNGIALAAAHTNYDIVQGGVSDVLAALLGLRATEPLARSERSAQAKLVVFTPAADLEAVTRALADAGAGAIGQYRECTFRTPGTGTFRGLEDAHPTVGRVGRREEVAELRLEAIVPLALAARAASAVRAAHSYEEPAIDLYPLAGGGPEAVGRRPEAVGLGRCGDLPKPLPAPQLVALIKRQLGLDSVRVVGNPAGRKVQRVAVLGGSGGNHVDDAVRRGCQLYLTGDVSHHQALAAEEVGLLVVDAGHAATEQPAIPVLARRLSALCPGVRFLPVRPRSAGPFRLA